MHYPAGLLKEPMLLIATAIKKVFLNVRRLKSFAHGIATLLHTRPYLASIYMSDMFFISHLKAPPAKVWTPV